jgi:hypothetical protein
MMSLEAIAALRRGDYRSSVKNCPVPSSESGERRWSHWLGKFWRLFASSRGLPIDGLLKHCLEQARHNSG